MFVLDIGSSARWSEKNVVESHVYLWNVSDGEIYVVIYERGRRETCMESRESDTQRDVMALETGDV